MLYLTAKHSHVGGDVDELACFLHRHMVCSRYRGGQSFLTGVVPSNHVVVGGGAFLGYAKPLGVDI
jgi:hypothetical protein